MELGVMGCYTAKKETVDSASSCFCGLSWAWRSAGKKLAENPRRWCPQIKVSYTVIDCNSFCWTFQRRPYLFASFFFYVFLVVVRISTCSLKFSILPGMMICQPFMTQFRKRTSHILTRPPAMTGWWFYFYYSFSMYLAMTVVEMVCWDGLKVFNFGFKGATWSLNTFSFFSGVFFFTGFYSMIVSFYTIHNI